MSLQGRTLRMVRAGKPVSVGERVSESDAFTLYRAWAGDAPLAVSWYPDLPGTRSLAKLLTWLVDIGSPHPAFTWPIDAPDHSERYVGSTSPFMAPEVVRGEAPVSWRSDRHSLAVLLFFLFMHGHPLDGSNTDPDAGDESEVALRAFGLEPVFVFDPKDDSNRPLPGDQALLWWPIYPRFVRTLFERAFTAGLSDPSSGRVTEEQWLSALARLEDCVWTCSCGASVLRDPDDPGQRCWNCELTVQ